ncbi:histone-lysine N-methyltransferase SETMAR [Trichonephila clavipes]|nr:histone-lysine N-methyltransferase SETMAR [Trichonephila clavipes]
MCDPRTSIHHDHSQMADKTKFTLLPTTTPPSTHACTLSSQITVVLRRWNQNDWGRIVFSDEFCFQLCTDDHRIRVWRRPGQRADARRRGPHLEVIVWGAISFDSRALLVVIRGTLTAQRFVDDTLRTVLLPFLFQYPGLIFQQDYAKPHTIRAAINYLTAYQTLPWLARSLSNRACPVYDGKELLPYGQTLHSDLYCQQLDHLKLAIDQKWPELVNRRGAVFLQDNSRLHTSVVTRQKLWELSWEILGHPSYSPDLAPSNYHIFLALPNFQSDKKLGSREDCENRLLEFLANKNQDFFL